MHVNHKESTNGVRRKKANQRATKTKRNFVKNGETGLRILFFGAEFGFWVFFWKMNGQRSMHSKTGTLCLYTFYGKLSCLPHLHGRCLVFGIS